MQIGKVMEDLGGYLQVDGYSKVNGEGFADLLQLMMGLVSQSDVQGLPSSNTLPLNGKEQGFPVTAEAGPEEDEFNKQNNLTQNNILVANPVLYNLCSIVPVNQPTDIQGTAETSPGAEAPAGGTFANFGGNNLTSQQASQNHEQLEMMVNLSPSGNGGNVTIQSKALTLEQGRVTGIPSFDDAELTTSPKQAGQGVLSQPLVEGNSPLQLNNDIPLNKTVLSPGLPENNQLLITPQVKDATQQVVYDSNPRPGVFVQEADAVIRPVEQTATPDSMEGNAFTPVKERGHFTGIPGQEGSELQPLPGNIDEPGSAVEITRVSAGKEKPLEKLLGQESTPNLPNDQELQQAEPRKNGTSVVPSQPVLNPKDEQQVDAGITREKPSLSVDQLVETGDAGNQPNGDLSGGKQNLDRSAKKETVPQKEGFSPEVKLHYAQETIHSSAAKPVEQNNISFLNREVPVTHLPVRLTEMIRAMLVQQSAGETTLKMRLKPEQLGEVTVKLTWSKGELTAQFVTSSGMAKEALESSFPQLKEVLAQHNIRLGEAAVFVGQQSGQGNQHSFSQSQPWYTKGQGKYKGGYPGIQVQEEPTSTGHILNEDTGVNIVV